MHVEVNPKMDAAAMYEKCALGSHMSGRSCHARSSDPEEVRPDQIQGAVLMLYSMMVVFFKLTIFEIWVSAVAPP